MSPHRPTLNVLDGGEAISIAFDDLLKYHGRSSLAGVVHAFKVMERAFPLLSPEHPPDRYGIEVDSAFPGPGTRDAFELVTRAVTGGRYRVTPGLAGPDSPEAPEGSFVFRLAYQGTTADLSLRPEHVNEEFNRLVRMAARTAADDERLVQVKQDIATRFLALPAAEVYDATLC